MLLGVPKEIKVHEYRVGMTPASVREVINHGHEVVMETGAGIGIGASNDDYTGAGATIADTAEDVFARADMIVKVKEPQAGERALLRPGQILFTYLHLAPDPDQTKDVVYSGAICVAYETVTDAHGGLPLLAPMSQVAGRMSIQAGAHCLEKEQGGAGVLIAGVPGVAPAKVVIIGGGVVGENAAYMATGLGADVTVLDRNVDTMRALVVRFGNSVKTLYSTALTIEEEVLKSDLVIGGVLVAGAKAPKLVSRDLVSRMKPGSVVVDVAIDQGGCFETSKPTTHADPTYVVDEVVHYCVANMPGAVSYTSTKALTNATLPYALEIANKGYKKAAKENPEIAKGINIYQGKVTHKGVSDAFDMDYEPLESLL